MLYTVQNIKAHTNIQIAVYFTLLYLVTRRQRQCHQLVGNTDDELLMNGQLQRTHACYHDYKAKIKLDWTDVISLQQHWLSNVLTHYLHTL